MLPLKEYRDKAKGLPDLLNFAAVISEGRYLNKDGSLMAGFFYKAIDSSEATADEINSQAAQINNIFARFGSGWTIHADVIRSEMPPYTLDRNSEFSDPVSRLIEEERKDFFTSQERQFESQIALVLSYLPPMAIEKKAFDFILSGKKKGDDNTQNILHEFNQIVSEFESSLSLIVDLRRMKTHTIPTEEGGAVTRDEFLSFANYCITGNSVPINLPPVPVYLDVVIGNKELWNGFTPKIGDKYLSVISIDGLPLESSPAMLRVLDQLPFEYRWSNRFICLDKHEALKELSSYRDKWKQKIRGMRDVVMSNPNPKINQHAVEMTQDANNAIQELESGLVGYGFYTSVVCIMHEDKSYLEKVSVKVRSAIQRVGFECRIETVNTLEAWLGSLPGHREQNVRRPPVNTFNLAHLMPGTSIWPGRQTNPCPYFPAESPPLMLTVTDGFTPFRFNLHVGDLGHTLVVGHSGSGKTTLFATIIAQFLRYPGAQVFSFDAKYGLYAINQGCGGVHYDLSPENCGLKLSPLAGIDDDGELAWAESWIESLLRLQGINITPKQGNEIRRAFRVMRNTNGDKSLASFMWTVQNDEIKSAIEYYTGAGPMGAVLDHSQDDLSLSRFVTFEIAKLMERGSKDALPVLQYLFHRIEGRLDGSPTIILIDEAWAALQDESFRKKIGNWLRVLRKANVSVILGTQGVAEIAESPIYNVIKENTSVKIFLPNSKALSEGTRDLYQKMGLNSRQIEILSNAIGKKHYYYTSSEGCRLFELGLGPLALSFAGSAGEQTKKRIDELKKNYSDKWIFQWMKEKGVPYEIKD